MINNSIFVGMKAPAIVSVLVCGGMGVLGDVGGVKGTESPAGRTKDPPGAQPKGARLGNYNLGPRGGLVSLYFL